jgi:hypothetical protein
MIPLQVSLVPAQNRETFGLVPQPEQYCPLALLGMKTSEQKRGILSRITRGFEKKKYTIIDIESPLFLRKNQNPPQTHLP